MDRNAHGLMNMPALFMRTVNSLFMDLLDNGVVVFLDDMLIYSTMVGKHYKFLEKVFAYLIKYESY